MEKITAINLMLYLLVVVILFHLCIMLKIVPYEISWGGRLKNDTEMYVFETISIIINLLLFSILPQEQAIYWLVQMNVLPTQTKSVN